jgi:hypothetical protein
MVNRFRPRLRRLAGTRTVKDARLVVLICLPLRLTTTICTGSSTLTRVRRVRAAQALDALTTGARESRACGEGFVGGVGSEEVTAWIARSKAPLSQVPPGGWGRATPRWSAEGQRELSAESIAGLPSRSAWGGRRPAVVRERPEPRLGDAGHVAGFRRKEATAVAVEVVALGLDGPPPKLGSS